MVGISALSAYGAHLVSEINTLNFATVVVDDSQIIKSIKKIKAEDNHLLYIVIPSTANEGAGDTVYRNVEMMFLVLEKNDRLSGHQEFLNVMQRTQMTTQYIERELIQSQEDTCSIWGGILLDSLVFDPIWGIAGCHGWTIRFNIKEFL